MKRICLIGGDGFIGSSLKKHLPLNDCKISNFDKHNKNNYENFFKGDVKNPSDLELCFEDGFDCLINLAAEHRDDVIPISLYFDTNVQGSVNICEKARLFNINKIIFISSVAVYGFSSKPCDEDSATNPFNEYGRTKLKAEKVYKNWLEEDPLNRTLIIIRPTAVFGENNRGNIYNLINQIRKTSFFMIGNGKNKKSIAYVENLSAFIIHSLSFSKGLHVYNYVDKPDFSMNAFIKLIKKTLNIKNNITIRIPFFFALIVTFFIDIFSRIFNVKFSISSIRVKKFCSDSLFNTKITNTGFKPPFDIEDALQNTIRYEFKKNNPK